MRTCAVKNCKGRLSQNGIRVHKLPDTDPTRSNWIKLVPSLATTSVKTPSVCCIHFKPTDYGGKGKKYLKAEAIPSRYLELDNDDGFKVTDLDQTSSPVFILPSISQCSKEECTDIFLKTKILQTENRNLRNYIIRLEKKLKDEERSQITKKDCMRKVLQGSSMLGPTQIKCLANDSTKGRGWTSEEKAKALLLKKMCNQKCYNFIRKNLCPLPCIWELNKNSPPTNSSTEKIDAPAASNSIKLQQKIREEESHNIASVLDGGGGEVPPVHHVVAPSEVYVWSDDHQKIEYLITTNNSGL